MYYKLKLNWSHRRNLVWLAFVIGVVAVGLATLTCEHALTDGHDGTHAQRAFLCADGQFEVVTFDQDSTSIRLSEVASIEHVRSCLEANPHANLIIEGHTDERGREAYNQVLGERLANAVRDYLVDELAVEPARLEVISFGEMQPVDPGHDESAWELNRRVEFRWALQ